MVKIEIEILPTIIIFSILIFLLMNFVYREFFQPYVLFLCLHNTFRSQMAEAYFEKFASEMGLGIRAKSAGFLEAEKINEKAIILMKEEGIDISNKKPKLVTNEMIEGASKIIVLCKECEEEGYCINLPKEKVEFWKLDNPAKMDLDKAREIRDIIKNKVLNLIQELKGV